MDNQNYLFDKNFLNQLFTLNQREIFIKLISLDLEENPLEEIIGQATGGSITVDGNSSVRRSCSLTLTTNELNIHEYYWGFKTKFKLFVGLKNFVNSKYPDIVWFKQGTFIITSFNTSENTSSYSISIQGKDKMSLLNGDLGGVVTALSVDFGKIIEIDDEGISHTNDYELKDIIKEAVHQYANEPYHNIIINDLDEAGLELVEFNAPNHNYNFYIEFDYSTKMPLNAFINPNVEYYYKQKNGIWSKSTTLLTAIPSFVYANGSSFLGLEENATIVLGNNKIPEEATEADYRIIAKYSHGDAIGYRITNLIYAGDLIATAGSSITSAVLDKIKSMLGGYEYFYNLEGQFVFQKQKTFVNTPWNSMVNYENTSYVENAVYTSSHVFSFENSHLVTSFTNTPNLQNVRNDYSIWGTKKTSSGAEIPIHMRYAIDKKPTYYKSYDGNVYSTEYYDWRELIYQMAQDYKKYSHEEDFVLNIAKNNPDTFPTGYTGYEYYYTDLDGFWRDIYNPETISSNGNSEANYSLQLASVTRSNYEKVTYDRIKKYYWYHNCSNTDGYIGPDKYYIKTEYGVFIKRIIDLNMYNRNPENYYFIKNNLDNQEPFNYNRNYYIQSSKGFDTSSGFKIDLKNNPENLNFWFDFLDSENSELAKYAVYNIGNRPKAENDSNIKALYYKEVPDFIFVDKLYLQKNLMKYVKANYKDFNLDINEVVNLTENNIEAILEEKGIKNSLEYELDRERMQKTAFTFLNLPNSAASLLKFSARGKTAKEAIDDYLYKYSYSPESVSLTTLPIYSIEPNTRIFIRNDNTNINGEYIVNRLTIPLTYNGTMNISATKAVERIY